MWKRRDGRSQGYVQKGSFVLTGSTHGDFETMTSCSIAAVAVADGWLDEGFSTRQSEHSICLLRS